MTYSNTDNPRPNHRPGQYQAAIYRRYAEAAKSPKMKAYWDRLAAQQFTKMYP